MCRPIFTLFHYGGGKIWCFMFKAMHKKLEFQNEVVKNGDGNSGESTQTLDESLQKKTENEHFLAWYLDEVKGSGKEMMASLKATKNIKISLYNVNAKNDEHISSKGLPAFTWYLMMKKCLSHDLHVFQKDLEMFLFFY